MSEVISESEVMPLPVSVSESKISKKFVSESELMSEDVSVSTLLCCYLSYQHSQSPKHFLRCETFFSTNHNKASEELAVFLKTQTPR